MRFFYKILCIALFSLPCFGQLNVLSGSTYKLYDDTEAFHTKDTSSFKNIPKRLKLEKFSTLWIKCKLSPLKGQDSLIYLFFEDQGSVTLYEDTGNKLVDVGQTGFIVPYHKRSIRSETAFITLLPKPESSYLIAIKNFNTQHDSLAVLAFSPSQYQSIKLQQKDSFLYKFGQPFFLASVAIILLITLFQLLFFRERVYLYYLLYIIFILLRVAMSINLLVIEDIFTSLRYTGFISRFSQTFSILSIIVYLLFIREFAETRKKAPYFDKFILFQILFMAIYMVVEVFVVVEKYTVPIHISIHGGFELLETLFSIITVWGLIKLYNNQNKYLIIGVVFLFLVAFVGQQLVLHLSSLSRLEQDGVLQILWGIAYLGEMVFFTVALFSRAAIMKKDLDQQTAENLRLTQALEIQTKDYLPINISTARGTIIIRQEEIIRLEASGNYTLFYLQNQKQVMASLTMAEFEDKLNKERFLRVHKSHIVNLDFVVKYIKGDGGSLILSNGSDVSVSRSRKAELLQKLFPVQ